jgi:hypothetical protein
MGKATTGDRLGNERGKRYRTFGIAMIGAMLVGGAMSMPAQPAGATQEHSTARAGITAYLQDEGAKATPMSDQELTTCFLGRWLHSHEEDTPETTVFRPEGYEFPPSWARTGYEFLPGGYLVFHSAGPADEPIMSLGTWELLPRARIAVEVSEPGGPHLSETLEIVSCGEDRLEVAL